MTSQPVEHAETVARTDLECRHGGEEGALEVDTFTEELLRVEDVTDATADALTHREAHVQHLLTHARKHAAVKTHVDTT